MAIKYDKGKLDIETPWDGQTGEAVEDFVSRNIPTSIVYDKEHQTLKLVNKINLTIASGEVTIETPMLNSGILILGIRVNGKVYTNEDSLVTLYTSDTKIELAVAAFSTAKYSTGESDTSMPVETTIAFGQNNTKVILVDPISIDKCTVKEGLLVAISISLDDWYWYNITDLFKTSVTSTKITATAGKATSLLDISITNLVISLLYNGLYIISNPISFILTGGNISDYHLEGFNGELSILTNSGIFLLSTDLLNPGLNLLSIRAVHNSLLNITTDYIYVNIVNTVGFNGSAVAINGINDSIKNNDTSLIYKIDAYSANRDNISISTYLEDTPWYDNPLPTLLLESITITALNYTDNVYSSTFSKYIEINSNDAFKHLVVKINNSWYYFYEALNNSITYGNSTALLVTAINSNFTYTANPYLSFDLINGRSNNIFTKDRWVISNDRTIYRVEANSGNIFDTPLNLSLSNEFTLEFGLKTYNVSDESKYIISLVNSGTSYFLVRPTTVCWNTEDTDLFNARNSLFLEGIDTHIIITMNPNYRIDKNDPYYPTYLLSSLTAFDNYTGTINLLRIYINGVIDREIALSDSELKYLLGCSLQINPTTSDLDLYVLRVYNTKALNFEEVKHNYLSFFKTYSEKETFYNKNDIVGNDGTISFLKTIGKYNTLLYVFPKNGIFPNRFWAGADNTSGALDSVAKKLPVTLFINYADNNKNLKYGGRITNGLVKGLGSSAMRYLIWNVAYLLNKMKDSNGDKIKSVFTPYSLLITETNKFKESPNTISGYYNMPPYEGLADSTDSELKITKLVGKVNFASSMLSHKEGACKLYNDAYKQVIPKLVSGGRKAVQEETFLYFYVETDLDSVDNIELADVLERSDIKFMGTLTWGSAKGDNATFGYDKKATPEYLLLEGGENTDSHVLFRRPWQALQRGSGTLGDPLYKLGNYPTVTSEESKEEPWKNLLIIDESITYTGARGAWDIDYGVEEVTAANGNTYFLIMDSVKPSLKKFREFLDFVYLHDYTMKATSTSTISSWDLNYKYCCTNQSLTEFSGHKAGNVYRYDDINNKWVNAGTEYNNGDWSVFNLFDFVGVKNLNFNTAINLLKLRFTTGYTDTNNPNNSYSGISAYIDTNDIAFHLAFIRFLSGTDNRAKNTYFLIIGRLYEKDSEGNYLPKEFDSSYKEEDVYKTRLMGDDLDTIIITDNNGLLSKAYNLLEPSYVSETASLWGDNGLNKFFYMFDLVFENNIKEMLKAIINYAFGLDTSLDNTNNNFYKFFYSILKDKIPAVAYNHTAKIYYEAALLIYNSNVFSYYKNNGILPIEQSHGACVEGEMHFMKKRYNFLASYALLGMGNVELDTASSAGSGSTLTLRIAFTPFLDFYPNYLYDNNHYKYYGVLNSDTQYDILKYRALADKEYTVDIKEAATSINLGLMMLNCFKKFDITGLTKPSLEAKFDRVTNFTIDNANIAKYPDLFGSDFTKLSISNYDVKLPVVEELNLKNIVLPDTIDLSTYTKLRTLNLSSSVVKRVILPTNVQDIVLPDTIETFELYNPVNSITFEGYSNMRVIYIDNINLFSSSKFDIIDFCNKVTLSGLLESITLHGLNNDIPLDTLLRLLQTDIDLTGTVRIVNSVGNLAPISFALKLKLIDKFGNIDNLNNSLYIQYLTIQTNTVSCEPLVNIYGKGYSGNPFNLSVDGNDVAIIKNNNLYIPDITYTMSISDSSVATIDSRTGIITLLKESESVTATVTISVKTISNVVKTSNTCTISFTWKAPLLGDFVYADGTYASGSINKNKTVMGIVYYVKAGTDLDSGTAYVVGTLYVGSDGFYVGYSGGGNMNTQDSSLLNLGYVKNYLETILSIENYLNVPNVSNSIENDSDSIDYSKIANIGDITNSGKEDTKAYILHVSLILAQLKNSYSSYISGDSTNGYYIATYEQLTNLLNAIVNAYPNYSGNSFMQCLLFPYFYATHLWLPTVKDSEKDTFNELFKAGNWYVPSYLEMRRLVYYRGLSAGGGKFTTNDVETDIKTYSNLTMFDNPNVPIFAKAYQAGLSIPTCWKSLVGNNNLCSTINGDLNYAYLKVATDYSGGFLYLWIIGYYNPANFNYALSALLAAWRLTKHRPLPCVQFKYSKNG